MGSAEHEWAALSLEHKVERLLSVPGTWEPDGMDAAMGRLAELHAREDLNSGLDPEVVDAKLWPGAAEQGWRVHATASGDGHYVYRAPTGERCTNKAEVNAIRAEYERRNAARPPR